MYEIKLLPTRQEILDDIALIKSNKELKKLVSSNRLEIQKDMQCSQATYSVCWLGREPNSEAITLQKYISH